MREDLDPEIAFQSGTRDPILVLLMRCLRTFTLVLFAIGGTVAVLAHRFDENLANELKSPAGLARSLASPLAVLAIAVVLRLLVTVLAFLLAARAIAANRTELTMESSQSQIRRAVDKWRLAGAFRSLRWTWAARDIAVGRLGDKGVTLAVADTYLRITAVILGLVFVVAVFRGV